jgi:hypothetical protein
MNCDLGGLFTLSVEDLVRTIKQSRKHSYIYHFTDKANLQTVKLRGLLSKEQQPHHQIFPRHPGGDKASRISDQMRGINNDVSLCLTRNHPMAFRCREDGRHPNQVYLGLLPEILLLPGVRVALGLANARATRILPIDEAIQHIDIDIIYRWVENPGNFFLRMSSAEKIEVLVPNGISAQYIKQSFAP